ncbi:unnamed protein product [Strongylus vulgaris]|uniref:TIL domain-containing protein n=1 Tax=Strongylus vulgaris TaxID=40348 RepID=A0A3P7JQQ6_STRVU|nr:unnamed protein product [Strongylus vulgaris]
MAFLLHTSLPSNSWSAEQKYDFSKGYAITHALFAGRCGKNEIFTTCGSACEPTCNKPLPTICTMQCVVGCQCKPGFKRGRNGCQRPGPGCL